MALDIKKAKRKLNFTAEKKEVYVATADRGGVIDTEKMAKKVAAISINTVSDGSSSSDATDGGSTGSGSTDSGEGGQELE